jgi:hypothetical protein
LELESSEESEEEERSEMETVGEESWEKRIEGVCVASEPPACPTVLEDNGCRPAGEPNTEMIQRVESPANKSWNDETLKLFDKSLKKLRISGTRDKSQDKLGPVFTSLPSPDNTVELNPRTNTMEEKESTTRKKEEDVSLESKDEDGKATKLDDADIKVRKWNSRLAKKLEVQLTPEMEAGMDVLRGFFLRRHKRGMTQSFLGWLHSQPKYKPCGIGMSLVVGLRTVVDPLDAEGGPVYSWSALGRAIYVDWWQDRFKNLRKNILAGRDALERLANTSWWDWEDGSRPLHWRWPKWYLEVIRDGLQVWFRSAPKQWQ